MFCWGIFGDAVICRKTIVDEASWLIPQCSIVQLGEREIDECQAGDLRNRLATFAQDWDAPEMNAYDELPSR